MASVADEFTCGRQVGQHQRSAPMIAGLSLGQQQDDGTPRAIAGGGELGVQAAPGSADTARKSPLLSRLAAVRCALSECCRSSNARAARPGRPARRRCGRSLRGGTIGRSDCTASCEVRTKLPKSGGPESIALRRANLRRLGARPVNRPVPKTPGNLPLSAAVDLVESTARMGTGG